MLVRKVRNQNKIGRIILSKIETDAVRRHGVPLKEYVKQMLIQIAKKRKWKWFFDKEHRNA